MLQGASSESEAVERHRHHLQRSLGVLTNCVWFCRKADRGDSWVIKTSPESVELRTSAGSPLYLTAAQNFVVNRHRGGLLGGLPFRGYKAHTTGYAYTIGLSPEPNDAMLEWHWHPPDPKYTHGHVHVRNEVLGNVGKLHLPTARVMFEQVVAFLIVGLGVAPLDEAWRTVISDVTERVKAASTWRGDRPGADA